MVAQLDKNLAHYDQIIQRDVHKNVGQIPGSGAAGDLGAGLLAFTNSHLETGIDLVIEYTGLKKSSKAPTIVSPAKDKLISKPNSAKHSTGS